MQGITSTLSDSYHKGWIVQFKHTRGAQSCGAPGFRRKSDQGKPHGSGRAQGLGLGLMV